jgi:hypothetical protein
MLLARGWEEDPKLWLLLWKGALVWGSPNDHGDSALHSNKF